MAVVYLAQDLKHNRKVAVKVLHPQIAVTLGAKQFLQEIQISAGLTHPHILPLHDSGEVDECVYYVMPYVEGETLRDRLDREPRLPLQDALQIADDIAEGLAYAHERGVVHQDIKPDNILIESGHAVIADFGVAGAISAAGGDGIAVSGSKGGTAEYGSPEQITGDQVDARSDLYSLGCVLYEMLAGQLPQVGPTPQAIMTSRINDPAPCITGARNDVPDHVAEALRTVALDESVRVRLRTVLARSPSERYATASEFRANLTPVHEQPGWVMAPSGPFVVAGIFIVSSLIVLTVVSLLVKRFGLPDWVLPGAVLLLIIGFPIIIATALVQRGTVTPPPLARPLLTWRRAIAGGVVALAGWGVVVTEFAGRRSPWPSIASAHAIAVLPFRVVDVDTGAVGAPGLRQLGVTAADVIVQGLTDMGLGEVVPMAPAESDSEVTLTARDKRAMAREHNAALLVTGSLRQLGDSLIMQAVITNLRDDRIVDSVGPVIALAASPLHGVDMLREWVMIRLAEHFRAESTVTSQTPER